MNHKSTKFQSAIKIVEILKKHGYKGFFAGGCVRDFLIGVKPKDYDIVTDALPNRVQQIFHRTISVGAQFGVVIVIINGYQFDVATFRKDTTYSDGRHPDSVIYSDEVEDVMRRDFTINGMLYDPVSDDIIDMVGGKADLKNKIIRTIGNPIERFSEDKLRILRAIRFACRFNYTIENDTFSAIKKFHSRLNVVSKERLSSELSMILSEGNARRGVELLDEAGLLKTLLPEVYSLKGIEQPEKYHPEGDAYTHTLIMLEKMGKVSSTFGWVVLLHDIGKSETQNTDGKKITFYRHDIIGAEMARNICKRYRFSKKETNYIVYIIKDHMKILNIKHMKKSTLKKFIRNEYFLDLLKLFYLDCISSNGNLTDYQYAKEVYNDLSNDSSTTLNPIPLITGKDLIEKGYRPGPIFKKILSFLEDAQLEGVIASKEEAESLLKTKFPIDE